MGSSLSDHIVGDDQDNYIDGSRNYAPNSAGDTLRGGAGDDTLVSHNIADWIDGGSGTDALIFKQAEAGDDFALDLAAGKMALTHNGKTTLNYSIRNIERFITGDGNDSVKGSSRDEVIATGAGTNSVHAGEGNDTLVAGKNSTNTLNGDAGDDVFSLEAENSTTTANGGEGNDTFLVGAADGHINGGDGFDTFAYKGSGRLFLDLRKPGQQATIDPQNDRRSDNNHSFTSENIELYRGFEGWDVMHGNDQGNIFNGHGVIDNLFGYGGDDTFVVDSFHKQEHWLFNHNHKGQYHGGDGSDTVSYEGLNASEISKGNIHSEKLILSLGGGQYSAGAYAVLNDGVNQLLHTYSGIENLVGSKGKDDIHGSDQNNVLNGVSGYDSIYGYGGNDTLMTDGSGILEGGAGHDTYVISKASRSVQINDIADNETDHLAFSGISKDELKVKFDDSLTSPALLFQIKDDNGNTVTLARWKLSNSSVSNTSWNPVFGELRAGISQIVFMNNGDEAISLATEELIDDFFIEKLLFVDHAGGINDARGRVFENGGSGTRGDDFIYGKETGRTSITGGEGADTLIAGQGQNTIHASSDDIIDISQGSGTVELHGANQSILIGGETGHYKISGATNNSTLHFKGVGIDIVSEQEIRLDNGAHVTIDRQSIDTFVLNDGTEYTWNEFAEKFDPLTRHLDSGYVSEKLEHRGFDTIIGDTPLHLTNGGNDTYLRLNADQTTLNDGSINVNVTAEGNHQNQTYNFKSFADNNAVKTIYDHGGDDVVTIGQLDSTIDSLLFRQVGDDLEIINLDESSTASLNSTTAKMVIVDHFDESGDHAIEKITGYKGDSTLTLATEEINKLVQATADFMARNGSEDDNGNMTISDNYNQLSQLTVSTLY